ncbi:hypothetical protein [Halorhodospira neutriphila]|uniref:Uncharacterized protein n=1 Tax=Halorhodospira neutriphila TaxID=168379 RepID=A0ABS1E591_9GAMM|nr:hypothetical protein [Halorhodospira neutriphila]MBK1725984.1 hypothetical protein [Halorhodospira neutriphila]
MIELITASLLSAATLVAGAAWLALHRRSPELAGSPREWAKATLVAGGLSTVMAAIGGSSSALLGMWLG